MFCHNDNCLSGPDSIYQRFMVTDGTNCTESASEDFISVPYPKESDWNFSEWFCHLQGTHKMLLKREFLTGSFSVFHYYSQIHQKKQCGVMGFFDFFFFFTSVPLFNFCLELVIKKLLQFTLGKIWFRAGKEETDWLHCVIWIHNFLCIAEWWFQRDLSTKTVAFGGVQ